MGYISPLARIQSQVTRHSHLDLLYCYLSPSTLAISLLPPFHSHIIVNISRCKLFLTYTYTHYLKPFKKSLPLFLGSKQNRIKSLTCLPSVLTPYTTFPTCFLHTNHPGLLWTPHTSSVHRAFEDAIPPGMFFPYPQMNFFSLVSPIRACPPFTATE